MVKEIPLEEAQGMFGDLVEGLRSGGEPVCLVDGGKAEVVMLNIDDYQTLIGAIRSLSSEWEGT
ncbi:MAG: type II toxin-antitoxin system Phd/YefM family antitoxin [Chloroflexi bacterium]|nr:type II toxin-antitoxin system Phd/YefM family antitoxin [Chloroflexota bacterium]